MRSLPYSAFFVVRLTEPPADSEFVVPWMPIAGPETTSMLSTKFAGIFVCEKSPGTPLTLNW